ncbi:MAG: hypothetical protein CFE25_02575 [Chitinophagaceae bacterium BSSC1]|nr:MAG: hypothetical protein CFE25_02575 [Chitinophagaceae bacterium BSSC1]
MKKQIFNKAGLFALLFGAMATMNSCSKDLPEAEADPTPSALVAVHNFALLVPSNLTVMLNNANLSVLGAPASIAYGGNLSGPYAGVKPGATTIGLRTLTGTTDLVSKSATLNASSATSVFAYDTLTPAGTIKAIALNNNMTASAAGTANLRFLNLSPTSAVLSAVLTRTADGFGVATTGSTTFGNVAYVGSTTPNEATLSNFTNIPVGTYSLALVSGTTNVFTTTLTIREGKAYSLVARGYAAGRPGTTAAQALGASLIMHNP